MYPVVGFILIVAVTGIAWVAAPYVESFIKDLFPNFRRAGMSAETFRWALTASVAGILLLVAMMLVAIGSRRRRPLDVRNSTLVKERDEMILDRKRTKRRQRQMNQKMRDHVRDNMPK
ncbi:MAG: hypothetical protein SGJ24_11420 [Chloroflexota bacterium]|nr:hypothetical protein [Chloroflexota bacterium]